MKMGQHQPVMQQEVLEGLNIKPHGCYVDATFGRGGHSKMILEALGAEGRLLVIDQDPEAIAVAKVLQQRDPRVVVRQGSFEFLETWCQELGWLGRVDGILIDLGVSSPQLDQAERGFSFLREGPLDMRMDNTQGPTAADWIQSASESEMSKIFKEYGEERFSKRIARAIQKARQKTPIQSTLQLAGLIESAVPRSKSMKKHPATRCFQAIRIHINQELKALSRCLEGTLRVLAPEGRLAVISFHSLEDRQVKQFIREQSNRDPYPPNFPIQHRVLQQNFRVVGKSQTARDEEIEQNVRARSARMRVAERCLVSDCE